MPLTPVLWRQRRPELTCSCLPQHWGCKGLSKETKGCRADHLVFSFVLLIHAQHVYPSHVHKHHTQILITRLSTCTHILHTCTQHTLAYTHHTHVYNTQTEGGFSAVRPAIAVCSCCSSAQDPNLFSCFIAARWNSAP